jgi:hypothetical protein
LNWTELLDPLNGGPGEPPGRVELVEEMRVEQKETPPTNWGRRGKGKKKGRGKG